MAGPDGLPYRFVRASHDYGQRRVPAEGIVVHMAEGCDVVGYLSGPNVIRGVSATFAVQPDGEVVQMLPLGHVSGSLNPRDVRTSNDPDGYWGRRWTRYYSNDILDGMVNHRTISIECAGRGSSSWECGGESHPPGPHPAQVRAIIGLVERLRAKYQRPLGVNGHRDFADYKACPGKGAGIDKILAAVGHGREDATPPAPEPDPCQPVRDLLEKSKGRVEELEDEVEALTRRLEIVRAEAREAGIVQGREAMRRDVLRAVRRIEPKG